MKKRGLLLCVVALTEGRGCIEYRSLLTDRNTLRYNNSLVKKELKALM